MLKELRLKKLARWVAPALESIGETDRDRAKTLNVSREQLQSYKHGRHEPPPRVLRLLARRAGLDPEVGELAAGRLPQRLQSRVMSDPQKAWDVLREAYERGTP